MTDTEIIKALERKTKAHCDVCDTKEVVPCEWCIFCYIKHSLGLINRQKAEIEELKQQIEDYELEEELKWEREVMLDDR